MDPFKEKNVRLYRWFTIAYSARAYYPVLAVLFLDLGLSLSVYVKLNALWALVILLFEIPSGALADVIGRKKLVLLAAVLMILEMGLIVFAPIQGGMLLLILCCGNRVISGLSEAAASGADQALAYDTLVEKGQEAAWETVVMPSVMRWRSVAFTIMLFLGGFLYDPAAINSVFSYLGLELNFTQAQTLRFPLILVLLQGIFCLVVALQMDEPSSRIEKSGGVLEVVRLTLSTVRWAFMTRQVAMIIIGVVIIDAFIRNHATVTSEYYRAIELPTWLWGGVSALTGLLGLATPSIASWLDRKYSAPIALIWIGGVAFVGLWGVSFVFPYFGVIPSVICIMTFGLFSYVSENNLHKLADSSRRATLLSVKGMAQNMGYGIASLGFSRAMLIARGSDKVMAGQESAFALVLGWQAWLFSFVLAGYIGWVFWNMKNKA